MTFNLTGINTTNKLSLMGKDNEIHPTIYKIMSLKKRIMKEYIIPLYSEQWDVLNKNKLLMDKLMSSLQNYYKIYKLEELTVYIELLRILKNLFDKNDLLSDYESRSQINDNKNIMNMVYKTTKITLLPEYELYNIIIGKPNRLLKETYNETIINDIKRLLTKENITYDKIKSHIDANYL
jgi:hypothetical protein